MTRYPLAAALLLGVASPSYVGAQPATAGSATQPAVPGRQDQVFSQEELDQLLAPVALYPDSLLTQVLMASTYPVEVVQADRWLKANPGLQGDQQAKALDEQRWDPSVKSLVNFPQVLEMMSQKLEWTTRLGDAFVSDERRVMDTVQALRAKAETAGTLKTGEQERVTVDETAGGRNIVIEPVQQDVVYVPVYDPGVVYGTWWYRDPPRYYWYPPAYPRSHWGIWYGSAYRCGPPWGYAWGRLNWADRRCYVDVDRNVTYNNTIDRARYRTIADRNATQYQAARGVWVHDPAHRNGVWYRDPNAARRYGGIAADEIRQQRDRYRGRPDVQRQPPQQQAPAPQQPNPRANTPQEGNVMQNRDGNTMQNPAGNTMQNRDGNVMQNRPNTPPPNADSGPVRQPGVRIGPREQPAGGSQQAPPNPAGPQPNQPPLSDRPDLPRPPRQPFGGGALNHQDSNRDAVRTESQRGQSSRSQQNNPPPPRSGGTPRQGTDGGPPNNGGGGSGEGRGTAGSSQNRR